jgi:hypothetical protein
MAQLLSNLPVGAKVKFGKYSVNGEVAQDVTWLVVAKNHSGYPTNSITLFAERIVDMRCFDAAEPNAFYDDMKNYGLGKYEPSNIRQWLNSNATSGWYSSKHTDDQSPSSYYVSGGTAYEHRPGFLNAFTTDEINSIIITPVLCHVYSGGYRTLSDKVFLPSVREISGTESEKLVYEGEKWEYFETNETLAPLTQQAYTNSLSHSKPSSSDGDWYWVTRSSVRLVDNGNEDYVYGWRNTSSGSSFLFRPNDGTVGIRPALNLSSTLSISDTTDSEGCYTFIWNTAPSMPTTLNAPTIYGGKSNAISWSKATDPDGDTLTYQLECSVNGGAYTQIYSGASTSYAHLVPFGTTSVAYRVKATDPSGAASEYKTSTTITVINNNAPVISGADDNLGVKSSGFTGTYTITDANNNSVTVTESIDGVQIRSLVATLGQAITYGITDNTWLALSNGSHTLTIRATDGIDTSVRTYTFTKLVETLVIRNSTPWVSTTMPSRIMLVITRNIPSTATFKVEVCNNGYDTSPTWEDCTDAVKSGLVHVFENTKKSASNWGVLVRVTVTRNGATGACYVSAIGGNFE